MRLIAAIAAILAGVFAAKDELKDAKTALEGEWKMVEFVKEGRGEDKDRLGTVTVKGDQMTIGTEKRQEVATFTLDPKASPQAIDIRPGKAGPKDPTVKGIYKLEKDKLTICFGLDSTDRPKEFKSGKDSKTGLFVLERVKK